MRTIGSVNSLVLVMLSCSVMSVRSITCYTCQADLVASNGTCQEPHKAQYCEENDWCYKTWRGPEDNIAGERRSSVEELHHPDSFQDIAGDVWMSVLHLIPRSSASPRTSRK